MTLDKLTRDFHDTYLESFKLLGNDIELIILADEGEIDESYIGTYDVNPDIPSKWKKSKLTFHKVSNLKLDKFEKKQGILDFFVTGNHIHIYTEDDDTGRTFSPTTLTVNLLTLNILIKM